MKQWVFTCIMWESELVLSLSTNWPPKGGILLINFMKLKYKFTYLIYLCKHKEVIYINFSWSAIVWLDHKNIPSSYRLRCSLSSINTYFSYWKSCEEPNYNQTSRLYKSNKNFAISWRFISIWPAPCSLRRSCRRTQIIRRPSLWDWNLNEAYLQHHVNL